jgi:glycosyltransferase involved in cell wall biosynthesis
MRETIARVVPTISVVTPTLDRPEEVRTLLVNLADQTHVPFELVLVDGAPLGMNETRAVISSEAEKLPFPVTYIRRGGGTALQRNIGIDAARGDLVAFIDDDMVLESNFFDRIVEAFSKDGERRVAAVSGYVTNQHFDAINSSRWRWYRRLNLFTIYEPGRFDYETGYVVNRYMQPPHDTIREIDCMGANCAVWRREIFDKGLRFSSFFIDYGVGEDAHMALSARRAGWLIWEYGLAQCVHTQSPRARTSRRLVAWRTAVNYRFVFVDIVPNRSIVQELRFWRVQLVELCREVICAFRRRGKEDWLAVLGKCEGIIAAMRVKPRNCQADGYRKEGEREVDLDEVNQTLRRPLAEDPFTTMGAPYVR